MALINCPECGKEISDKAEHCIHCGFPIILSKQTLNAKPIPNYANESFDRHESVDITDRSHGNSTPAFEGQYQRMSDASRSNRHHAVWLLSIVIIALVVLIIIIVNDINKPVSVRKITSVSAKQETTSSTSKPSTSASSSGQKTSYTTYSSSSTSSFTNKYGTRTTKCAHPGCTNYIASSGDTNCCTTHSNRCAECGKYIDEDAYYCMDCLTNAAKKIQNGK